MIKINDITFFVDSQVERVSLDFSGGDSLSTLISALLDAAVFMKQHGQHDIADHRRDLSSSLCEQISEIKVINVDD